MKEMIYDFNNYMLIFNKNKVWVDVKYEKKWGY